MKDFLKDLLKDFMIFMPPMIIGLIFNYDFSDSLGLCVLVLATVFIGFVLLRYTINKLINKTRNDKKKKTKRK